VHPAAPAKDDGCEQWLLDAQTCGSCSNACPAGMTDCCTTNPPGSFACYLPGGCN
jgi:hypothetical protein